MTFYWQAGKLVNGKTELTIDDVLEVARIRKRDLDVDSQIKKRIWENEHPRKIRKDKS